MQYSQPHKFHIPVMGLAYTIDSPIKVARFGISSVISIIEDRLVEMMRGHYYAAMHMAYVPITVHEEDYRAKRVTDYLNLVNTIVQQQVEKLRNAVFEAGSEIVKYFEMLPDDSALKQLYRQMMSTGTKPEKTALETYLRTQIKPGSIDVNIMTKLDRDAVDANGDVVADGSDAVAALRGYAKSELKDSSIVFSAGMNPRLYNYLETCPEFEADDNGTFTKKVVVKVSDYRSALIQGKYLAKKGIWVSEFRVESGLNCGGHAFATDGFLMGPILEEFKTNRQALMDTLFEIWNAAQLSKNSRSFATAPQMLFSAQGGIGTHQEDAFLHQYYQIDSTGWGTPFLLVPEATTVDSNTLTLLSEAGEKDVHLSRNSPLGVRFHYLKGTSSDTEKLLRIGKGRPGSPCTEKHLAFNTEFTKDAICTASAKYQKLKIEQLQSLGLPEAEYKKQLAEVLDKECLCVGLSNAAAITYNHVLVKNRTSVNICPGPNIAYFSKLVSLQSMVGHIYGRENIMANTHRPNMFIKELALYLDYLEEQLDIETQAGQMMKKKKYFSTFFQNLGQGIEYYHAVPGIAADNPTAFTEALKEAGLRLVFLQNTYMADVAAIAAPAKASATA